MKPLIQRRHIPLAVVLAATLVGGMAMAVRHWNYEFIYYGVVLVVLAALVWWVDRRVTLSTAVLWAFLVWAIAHLLGGMLPIPGSITEPGTPKNLYNMRLHPWLPKYDQVVHAFGFGVTTLAAWRAMASNTDGCGEQMRATTGPLTCALLVGMGLGAMNEVIEFVATLIMPETNVGGYRNTGWDLVSNLCGCVAAVAWIRVRETRRSPAG